jgi:hypothetical protein
MKRATLACEGSLAADSESVCGLLGLPTFCVRFTRWQTAMRGDDPHAAVHTPAHTVIGGAALIGQDIPCVLPHTVRHMARA